MDDDSDLVITAEEIERVKASVMPYVSTFGEAWIGLAKWVLASLLLINGAAIVSLFNSPGRGISHMLGPIGCFTGGIFLAMLSGMWLAEIVGSGFSLVSQLMKIENRDHKWREISVLQARLKNLARQGPGPTLVGIASLLSFVAGVIWSAVNAST